MNYGYNPYLSYMQGVQNPYPMPSAPQPNVQRPIPQTQNNGYNGLIYVLGEEEAKAFYVAPGNAVPLFDKDKPIMYIKSVDMNGMPFLMKCNLVYDNNTPSASDSVTRDEFTALSQVVEEIKSSLSANTAAPTIEEAGQNG